MFVVFQDEFEEWKQVDTDHVCVNTYYIIFSAKRSDTHYVFRITKAASISDRRDPEVELNDR